MYVVLGAFVSPSTELPSTELSRHHIYLLASRFSNSGEDRLLPARDKILA